MDIGANDGHWSESLMQWMERQHTPSPTLMLIEPQKRFHRVLSALATRWNGTLLPAAAWIAETNVTLHTPLERTIAASVHALHPSLGAINVTTPAFDLAAHMREHLGAAAAVLMKLDVEGSEYVLLPHLLERRVLCSVDFLHVEWHPNLVAPAEGRELRCNLEQRLRLSCPGERVPSVLTHEDPAEPPNCTQTARKIEA